MLEVIEDDGLRLTAIKPNIDELSDIEEKDFEKDIDSIKAVLDSSRYANCEWIVLSLGGAGSLVKHFDDYYRVSVPKIDVVSPVGSGDSTVAGFAYGLLSEYSNEDVMRSAMTTGVLNSLNEQTGSIDFSRFEEIFKQITVEKI